MPGRRPVAGPSQRAHFGAGTGGVLKRALPPHDRPQVRTLAVFGVKWVPHAAHARTSGVTRVDWDAMRYMRSVCSAMTAPPDAATCSATSGSADMNLAPLECPSPSHTPRAYGGTGRSLSGSSSGAVIGTAWLGRPSAPGHRRVRLISAVVTTSGSTDAESLSGSPSPVRRIVAPGVSTSATDGFRLRRQPRHQKTPPRSTAARAWCRWRRPHGPASIRSDELVTDLDIPHRRPARGGRKGRTPEQGPCQRRAGPRSRPSARGAGRW